LPVVDGARTGGGRREGEEELEEEEEERAAEKAEESPVADRGRARGLADSVAVSRDRRSRRSRERFVPARCLAGRRVEERWSVST